VRSMQRFLLARCNPARPEKVPSSNADDDKTGVELLSESLGEGSVVLKPRTL
jgi:hypothetical protein